ncbi:MAG TPA: hypothetical protein VGS05_00100 [Candidatus Sulfotelmatobacter sp.]|nr:hypothetical protein [Candidatus Sulfotelmatobacter sp.]
MGLGLVFRVATLGAVAQDINWQQTVPIQNQRIDPPGWNPPNTDAKIRSLTKSPSCDLAAILDQTGGRAAEFAGALEKFTAQESIEYKRFDRSGDLNETHSGVFDYTFAFEELKGGRASQEYRAATKGSRTFPEAGHDVGEVALALIFHPSLQTDYEMACEGMDHWKGQQAWVIRFEQRKDRPTRTFQFKEDNGIYPAMLEGRAWVSSKEWQILHLEINLTQVPSGMRLEGGAMSIDYAAVPVASGELTLWLPQRFETYWEFRDYRAMLIHSFSKFQVFLVKTKVTPK